MTISCRQAERALLDEAIQTGVGSEQVLVHFSSHVTVGLILGIMILLVLADQHSGVSVETPTLKLRIGIAPHSVEVSAAAVGAESPRISRTRGRNTFLRTQVLYKQGLDNVWINIELKLLVSR